MISSSLYVLVEIPATDLFFHLVCLFVVCLFVCSFMNSTGISKGEFGATKVRYKRDRIGETTHTYQPLKKGEEKGGGCNYLGARIKKRSGLIFCFWVKWNEKKIMKPHDRWTIYQLTESRSCKGLKSSMWPSRGFEFEHSALTQRARQHVNVSPPPKEVPPQVTQQPCH